MSFRYPFAIVKPGLNVLVSPTPSYTYEIWGWGANGNGQLATGNYTYYSSPKQSGSSSDWAAMAAHLSNTSLAIKTDGTLWGWGQNNTGQIGDGTRTQRNSPVQIGALTNWSKVETSYGTSAAIKTDGSLWTWGNGYWGQLGNGLSGGGTYRSSPTQVGSLTTWLNVAINYNSMLATKTDGTIWSWGRNDWGNLGLGNRTGYSSPKQIGVLTNWLSVSGGTYYTSSLAIKTDGTLWVWGSNYSGQLGLGNTTSYSSPKQVGALTNWLKVSGGYGALAVKTNGTLWSWGLNQYGQMGIGNTTAYSSPKQVGALTTWSNVSKGLYHATAVQSNGTLWAWGINSNGQLGLGNTTNYSSPKQVGSLTTWLNVAASFYSTLGMKY